MYQMFLLALLAFAQPKGDKISIRLQLSNCVGVDSVYAYEFAGMSFRVLQTAPVQNGTVQFTFPAGQPRFVYVGRDANNMKPLIVGKEPQVELQGDCNRIREAQIVQSQWNTDYENLRSQINTLRTGATQLTQEYRQVASNQEARDKVVAKMKIIDQQKLSLLDSMKIKNPYLGKVVALNTYLSYQNHGAGFENEVMYFAREYFKQVNWKDADFNGNPWVFESWKAYTETITNIGLPQERHQELLEQELTEIAEGTSAHQLALSGIVQTLQQKNHPNYLFFAKHYIDLYGAQDPAVADGMRRQIESMQAFVVGGVAPDFTMATPEGGQLALSSLRGKYLLIDFWASWCGPCRRENPNVVKVYNQYKEKGFEILGVSLDSDKTRWLNAIQQDGLTWHQVSDLKGWQNSAAQQYGVRSIPHTVLLDPQGKIVARNLRGAALEQKLAEIFGE